MVNLIQFPKSNIKAKGATNPIGMTLTRNINGLTVSINLATLSKEELLQALMPLPSESKTKCEKVDLVMKYINN